MSNVLTIASKLIQEALRNYGIWGMVFVVLMLMLLLPNQLQSDDTLRGKVQLVMNYSLILIAIFIHGISLFFSCYSFSQELKTKQYYLLDAKPLHRWQFFWGKFVGIAAINLVLLSILAAILYIFLIHISKYQGTPEERKQLAEQLFVAYRGIAPEAEQAKIAKLTSELYLKLKRENRLEEYFRDKQQSSDTPMTEAQQITEIRKNIVLQEQALSYRQSKSWKFFPVNPELRDAEVNLKLRYKFIASEALPGYQYRVHWRIGQGNSQYAWEEKVKPGEMLELTVPSQVIQSDATVSILFVHVDPDAGIIYFPISDGIELCYPAGSFTANYFKNLLLIYGLSCFLAVIGLFTATFLSFSVAMFFGLFVLLVGAVANFILEMFPRDSSQLTWWQFISQHSLQILLCIIPDFSHYSQSESLTIGRIIEWLQVLENLIKLFLRIAILGLLGCWFFNKKEIGNPRSTSGT